MPIKIFVDQPETEKVVLEFPKYKNTLSEIILNSTPQFSVGIFGEWGTGKTTLMKSIEKVVNKQVNTIEFNAWRYEGEKRHATYPLMLEILGKLIEEADIKRFLNEQKPEIKEKLTQKIGRVLKGLSGSVGVNAGIANVQLNIEPEKMKLEERKMSMKDIWNYYDENKSALQEGVELITIFLKNMKGPENNSKLKLVVFIDDLDRCTPEKAAEVFESIKVFFDINGMVFVLGLSTAIVEAAINKKYAEFPEGIFNGKEYLKKIIQVPFTLPVWTENDIEIFIDSLLESYNEPDFKTLFIDNKLMISKAVNANPREVKRLLNNFLMISGIYENRQDINKKYLLTLQAISVRWRWFYDHMFSSEFSAIIKSILGDYNTHPSMSMEEFLTDTTNKKMKGSDELFQRILDDKELTEFLDNYVWDLFKVTNIEWEEYRRAGESESSTKIPIADSNEESRETYLDKLYARSEEIIEEKNKPSLKKEIIQSQNIEFQEAKTASLRENSHELKLFEMYKTMDLELEKAKRKLDLYKQITTQEEDRYYEKKIIELNKKLTELKPKIENLKEFELYRYRITNDDELVDKKEEELMERKKQRRK